MTRILPLALLSFASVAACGVNELPQYRGQIDDVVVSALVLADAELDVSEPAVVAAPDSPYGPSDHATESYVITNLAERMRTYLDPDLLARSFGDAFAPTVTRGTGWSLIASEAAADARVVAEVDGFGLSVDAMGEAEVYFRMTARAWFVPTNQLIYESWSSHRVPLTVGVYGPRPPYVGDDPEAMAVARIYNLLALNDISGPELRAIVSDAAADAARTLARELVAANND